MVCVHNTRTMLSSRPKRKYPDPIEGFDMKNIIGVFNTAGYRAGEMSSARWDGNF